MWDHSSLGGRSEQCSGSALLLVLLVLMGTVSMVSGIQHLQVQRSMDLRISSNQQRLRSALILGLQEAATSLAESDWEVDVFSEEAFQRREFESSEGVQVRLQLRDAQDRFNLNDLSLPLTPGTLRSPWDMFEDLLRAQGVEVNQGTLAALRGWVEEEEVWFDHPDQLNVAVADQEIWQPVLDSLSGLPRPANRSLAVNVNTVRPEVLRAMVGPSLHGWADSVVAARDLEPLHSISNQVRFLPEGIRPVLEAALDVQSEYVEADLVAEVDHTRKTLRALLHRGAEGKVEVIRCQW
ncbi:MAG: type II secretion system protein GspK [Kiritimatiellae bacterium]|nr:type II secretion system protein GspK [Kiritimatiellia bacterium]